MSTSALFAALETRLTGAVFQRVSNVLVTPTTGSPFLAIMDVGNTEFFETAKGCDFVLRYAVGPALDRGDTLTVSGSPLVADGEVLRVAEKPMVQNAGHEYLVPLVRAA